MACRGRSSSRRRRPRMTMVKKHRAAAREVGYVRHVDKDLLLYFPGVMEETYTVVKRVRRAEDTSPAVTPDCGWGSRVPPEILHRVFQLVVGGEGALPALCRVAQVCRLWRQVAGSPDLWQRVSVSHCWTIPGPSDPPRLKNKVKETIEDLMQHRLSQVSVFSLHHWKYHVPSVLQGLAASCPLLTSLTLSYCSKVTKADLECVGAACPHLTSLNLQNSQVSSDAVSQFLAVHGAGLRALSLSFNFSISSIFSQLVSGSCPDLRFLEVNRDVKERLNDFHLFVEGLQTSCPKLEVLRLLNVSFFSKCKSSSSPEGPGFCHLQELCLATSSYSQLTDSLCKRLLRDCIQLRVLDLRGCYKMTPEGLCDLPCTDIEHLYLGMYCCEVTRKSALPSFGCSLLTRRWRHSLQELDLTGLNFSEEDLSEALGILSGGNNNTLQSLSLTGTRVPAAAVREVLCGCRALIHLDLSSCREIPRGLKCVYRGRENMHHCLETLSAKMQDWE